MYPQEIDNETLKELESAAEFVEARSLQDLVDSFATEAIPVPYWSIYHVS